VTIRHRITIKDVARDASVSQATVSNWLRGQPNGMSAETRERVGASARKLGYRPSGLARGLRGHGTLAIGLIVPSITNPSMPPIIRGAEDRASELGYGVFLSNIDRQWDKAADHALAMVDKGVEAIGFAFSIAGLDAPAATAASSAGVPVGALLPAGSGPIPAGVVGLDNEAGMRQVVDHLWNLGHRRFGFATNTRVTANGPHRRAGLAAALASRGASLDVRNVAEDLTLSRFDEWEEIQSGRRDALSLLATSDRPTAICAVNDLLAIGVVLAAGDLGLRVPEDLSVVGFDELTAGRVLRPPLTTINVPLYEMGRHLVAKVIEPTEKAGLRITPSLVVRGSTGAAPKSTRPRGHRMNDADRRG
jgi:LacI family transcriptional regulator